MLTDDALQVLLKRSPLMEPSPLKAVVVVVHEWPRVAALSHVATSISEYLDRSVEIPLGRACQLGSATLLDRIWQQSDPARQSADQTRFSLCVFLRSDRHYYNAQFAESLTVAVHRGDLDAVRWLFQHFHGCIAPAGIIEEAASAGHLQILQYMLDHARRADLYDEETAELEENNINGVCWGGKDMALAAKGNHADVVRWLYEYTGDAARDLSRVMIYAVRRGNLLLVQWLLANVYQDVPQLSPPTINDAARGGHLHVIQWLFDQGYIQHVGDAFRNAAMSGYFDIVKWLVAHDILENVDEGVSGAAASGFSSIVTWLLERNLGLNAHLSMYLAAINGHFEVSQYVHSKGIDSFGEHMMYMACERGHLDVVKWLYSEFSSNPDINLFPIIRPNAEGYPRYSCAMDAAASNGHLSVLQFLHSVATSTESSPERRKRKRSKDRSRVTGGRVPTCTRAAMTNAASEGHLHIVQWLHANRPEGCSPSVINSAARNGHLKVVKWLHENVLVGCTKAAMDGAAANGHLDVVQWLHENRTEGCTSSAMDRAAAKGHLETVQWLHTHRREGCTTFAMDSAARSGHLNVVKWLHRHRLEGCTDNAMDGAAYNGHISVVQWLHVHRTEGCSIDAMHFAAVHGHFEVLLFLHSQRSEGCSRYTTIDAAARGHSDIVAWLRQHYPES